MPRWNCLQRPLARCLAGLATGLALAAQADTADTAAGAPVPGCCAATESSALAPAPATPAAQGLLGALVLTPSNEFARPVQLRRQLQGVLAGTAAVTAPARVAPSALPAAGPDPGLRPAAWHAGLGLTLSGGDRIGIRRADGGVQLVWRRPF